MVRFIQGVFEKSIKFVGKWAIPFSLTLLITLGFLTIVGLVLYFKDTDAFYKMANKIKKYAKNVWIWIVLIAIVLLELNLLVAVRRGVIQRVEQANSALYTSREDPCSGEASQRGPTVSYEDILTSTRRLIISQNKLEDIFNQGINMLPGWSPETLRYRGRPAINIEDNLEKDEDNLVVKRKITISRYKTLKLNSSDIKVDFSFKEGKKSNLRRYYKAKFNGVYTFKNPFNEKKLVRFDFPLPLYSGNLSGFSFKVDGKEINFQDVSGGCSWKDTIEPNKTVKLEISYAHQGAKSWSYILSGRRESISNFKLKVNSDNKRIKFRRSSLFPDSIKKGILKNTLLWDKKNVITSQDISLYFPGISITEIITRMYIFAPITLIGFILILFSWRKLKKVNLEFSNIILSSLSFAGAYVLASYLLTYMPLYQAIIISFVIAGFINILILSSKMAIPVITISLVPMAFMWVGNTGLALSILGLLVLGLTGFLIRVNHYSAKG